MMRQSIRDGGWRQKQLTRQVDHIQWREIKLRTQLQVNGNSEDTVFTRLSTIVVGAAILLVPLAISSSGIPVQASAINAGNGSVICSVMEAFDEGKLGVRAIVFHQRDKADGPRLGSLLWSYSGEEMELQTADGQRYKATVFRVKSAFGRGLVLIPIGKFKLGEHDEFTLWMPGKN